MTKILHVSEALGGGIYTAVTNYARLTPEYSHSVFARARTGQETHEWPASTTVELFDGSMWEFLSAAVRHVTATNPDVVHLHSSYAGLLRAMLRPNYHIVYSPHCYAMERSVESPVKITAFWMCEKALAQREQLLVAVSPREVELGQRLNRKMQACLVPNLPGDAAEMPSRTSANTVVRETKLVAMLGRITPQKDPDFFIEVVKAVQTADVRYIWIGDGDEASKNALLAVGVEVTGWVSPQRVSEILRDASLYLHTALWEGAPLSTIEAAYVQCPVLSRSIDSMESLGYALAGETPISAARSIEQFFANEEYRKEVRAKTDSVLGRSSPSAARAALIDAYSTRPSRRRRQASLQGQP